MSRNYKFHNPLASYFVSFSVVGLEFRGSWGMKSMQEFEKISKDDYFRNVA